MDHFRVLPTDPRIQNLTDEQCEILFLNHMRLPDSKVLKKNYFEHKQREDQIQDLPEEEFLKMGYTQEAIQRIKDNILHG